MSAVACHGLRNEMNPFRISFEACILMLTLLDYTLTSCDLMYMSLRLLAFGFFAVRG